MATPIVHNTGTNYTNYYNVINYFKTIMSNHPSIGACSLGDLWDFGERQFPQYPIANIQILNTDFGTSVTNYTVQLMVADKVKNKNNESDDRTNAQTIPYYQVDDKVDIYANTLAILNDLTSYTQRGVQGFEINSEINCTPFADRLDNGVAGWTAEFTLTTHNDKNRCLFFLIPTDTVGYLIENCQTGERYKAILDVTDLPTYGVFNTLKAPGLSPTYDNLVCYSIVEPLGSENNWDFYNLPVLQPGELQYCSTCILWINPKIWGTTPAKWGQGTDVEFRQWIND